MSLRWPADHKHNCEMFEYLYYNIISRLSSANNWLGQIWFNWKVSVLPGDSTVVGVFVSRHVSMTTRQADRPKTCTFSYFAKKVFSRFYLTLHTHVNFLYFITIFTWLRERELFVHLQKQLSVRSSDSHYRCLELSEFIFYLCWTVRANIRQHVSDQFENSFELCWNFLVVMEMKRIFKQQNIINVISFIALQSFWHTCSAPVNDS